MHRLFLVMFLLGINLLGNSARGDSSYVYASCDGWGYGYSGTFSCPGSYSGATRSCRLIKIENGHQTPIDYWNEEGCATGVTADSGYCVKNCRN